MKGKEKEASSLKGKASLSHFEGWRRLAYFCRQSGGRNDTGGRDEVRRDAQNEEYGGKRRRRDNCF